MNSGQFIQWHDLFVVIDDGLIPIKRYELIESAMREQAKLYPQGLGCLVILPPDARPPSDEIKRAVKGLLSKLASSLSSLGYIVEGTGFKGVAARAALVGMKIFASRPYPIYVETSIREVLSKMLPHLADGQTVTQDVKVIMNVISDARMTWIPPPPPTRVSITAK
ncbi:MAG TPA: hypothetical protein VH165_08435 [Kofleriaceae bacterium]|nr:hypothetical protein [Kofleriaceae bacterium]